MMNEAQITVGELSSFMLYAAFVGVSISGRCTHDVEPSTCKICCRDDEYIFFVMYYMHYIT